MNTDGGDISENGYQEGRKQTSIHIELYNETPTKSF